MSKNSLEMLLVTNIATTSHFFGLNLRRTYAPELAMFFMFWYVVKPFSFQRLYLKCIDQLYVHLKEMSFAVRCLKSNEDMILALAGQFKQLSHEPEKFR